MDHFSGLVPSEVAASIGLLESAFNGVQEPLIPDVCLEWTWADGTRRCASSSNVFNSVKRTGVLPLHRLAAATPISLEAASKAFLTEDAVGQRFLCYLLSGAQQLRCLRLNFSAAKIVADSEHRPSPERIICGPVTTIPCKDATAMPVCQLLDCSLVFF